MTKTHPIVAAVQLASGSNREANCHQAEQLLEKAAKAGAQLTVLPENFGFMGKDCHDLYEIGEADGDGPLQSFLSETAARLGIWIVGGTVPIRESASGKVRAACIVFDDSGQRVVRYDKMHLFDVDIPETNERYRESDSIEPGDQVVTLDTPFGRMGVAICYDLRFPELFRAMAEQGADLFVLPSAFTAATGKAHWHTLVRARAIENMAYVVAAGQGGFHVNGRETFGHSLIVDPWGNLLAEQTKGAGAITASLDAEQLAISRRNFPVLQHRRLHCQP